jgi:hypothetical protein
MQDKSMATPDLAPAIDSAAQQPLSASVTAGGDRSVQARSIGDMIQADRYANAKAARGKLLQNIFPSKVIVPGPISDQQGTYPVSGPVYPWF